MASSINSTSAGNGGLVSTGDDSGILNIQTNETTAITVDASQRVAFVAGTAALPAITTAGDTNTGIFFPAADTIAFSEGGAESMRIDSSGNVGIGATNQNEKLVVNGAIRSTNNAAGATATADSGVFYFVPTADAPSDPRTILQGVGTAGVGASIAFFTGTSASNTERMRIDSSGNLQLKGTGGTSTFNVFGNATITDQVQIFNNPTSSAQGILFRNTFNTGPSIFSTGAATTNSFISWVGGSGTQGSIVGNGSGINYNTTSDYRLKENVSPMTGALGVVAQLKPCTYTWKFDGADGHGFIAHELQEIFPAAVSGKKDAVDKEGNPEYQGVDTSYLVATLTAALQETKALIDTQAETINALTARIVLLESKP